MRTKRSWFVPWIRTLLYLIALTAYSVCWNVIGDWKRREIVEWSNFQNGFAGLGRLGILGSKESFSWILLLLIVCSAFIFSWKKQIEILSRICTKQLVIIKVRNIRNSTFCQKVTVQKYRKSPSLQIYTAGIWTRVKSVKVTSICHRYYHVKV